MAVEFITLTAQNIHWALNENIKRALNELRYKVPKRGVAVLQGDWDFQNEYTVRNVTPAGEASAYSAVVQEIEE